MRGRIGQGVRGKEIVIQHTLALRKVGGGEDERGSCDKRQKKTRKGVKEKVEANGKEERDIW